MGCCLEHEFVNQLSIQRTFSDSQADYSNKWRFNFGIKNTKCMVIGKSKFSKYPEWFLGSQRICVSESLEILGTVFTGDYKCDIFGYHIWLQSDAAFYYPRLDKYSFSVGMFWVTCDLTRRPLGRLATASSLEGNASRHGERGLVVSVLGKFLMGQDLSQIYERYH